MDDYKGEKADLALSLDVIYHLIEDRAFNEYMGRLFNSAKMFVIIYSSNHNENEGYEGTHVKHRIFTDWVDSNLSNWELETCIPKRFKYYRETNEGSCSDFFIFRKTT